MEYRYHPEIEGLKTNAAGTEIVYSGEPLDIRRAAKKVKGETVYVYLNNKTYTVSKLVCECWHGMADNPRMIAKRKDHTKGYHKDNLFWAKRGRVKGTVANQIRRSKLSSLKKEDVSAIEERLRKGDTLKTIATDYNTSDMSISRIKKQMKNG